MKDLIERQKAIDALKDWYDGMIISSFRGVEKVIKALPSAQPENEERTEEFAQNVPKEDLISRKAAIDVAENAFVRGLLASPDIRKLPSAESEP